MTFEEISALLTSQFPVAPNPAAAQPYLTVPVAQLLPVCRFLRNDERLFFDQLACVTAIDNGPEANTMEVVYNLCSIPYEHQLMLKVAVPRTPATSDDLPGNDLPTVPSLTSLWRTADWHEREAYDLVGIRFAGHPDLRRILLPTDWQGHPLRTDYVEPERYHGIFTK